MIHLKIDRLVVFGVMHLQQVIAIGLAIGHDVLALPRNSRHGARVGVYQLSRRPERGCVLLDTLEELGFVFVMVWWDRLWVGTVRRADGWVGGTYRVQ